MTVCSGAVRVYDYMVETLVAATKFNQPGTALLWLPKCVRFAGNRFINFLVLRCTNICHSWRYCFLCIKSIFCLLLHQSGKHDDRAETFYAHHTCSDGQNL